MTNPLPTIGVLGGGQLGRMLLQAGIDLNLRFHVLDPDAKAPCRGIAHKFTQGKLQDYFTVCNFGLKADLITIEIEHVDALALEWLAEQGKQVFPSPAVVKLVQDKRAQKQFYRDHDIPTADFVLTENRADVAARADFLPAFHKLGKAGYDGRGVQHLATADDLTAAFDAPGVLEKRVEIAKEISVIAARRPNGEVRLYPPVEMVFHPEANLVEYLFAPADLDEAVCDEVNRQAERVVTAMGVVGLLAVELFVDRAGKVLVNEVAPRPHNSGHHTIEANVTSQYEQHLRAILDLPLGSPATVRHAAMVNLLGAPGHTGPAHYEGLADVLAMPGAHVHLYGKQQTKPFRKMGHVTLVGEDPARLRADAQQVKEVLRIVTKEVA
ncbi:MAG: 5-(carboxyamino)imidazole ribonucleotide synthase [Catalinimonas sp.]